MTCRNNRQTYISSSNLIVEAVKISIRATNGQSSASIFTTSVSISTEFGFAGLHPLQPAVFSFSLVRPQKWSTQVALLPSPPKLQLRLLRNTHLPR